MPRDLRSATSGHGGHEDTSKRPLARKCPKAPRVGQWRHRPRQGGQERPNVRTGGTEAEPASPGACGPLRGWRLRRSPYPGACFCIRDALGARTSGGQVQLHRRYALVFPFSFPRLLPPAPPPPALPLFATLSGPRAGRCEVTGISFRRQRLQFGACQPILGWCWFLSSSPSSSSLRSSFSGRSRGHGRSGFQLALRCRLHGQGVLADVRLPGTRSHSPLGSRSWPARPSLPVAPAQR